MWTTTASVSWRSWTCARISPLGLAARWTSRVGTVFTTTCAIGSHVRQSQFSKMQRSIRLRLNDIICAIDGAAVTIAGAKFETFQLVYHMPRTVERSIEIISEASRHSPQTLKTQYPDIPWKQIAGIGNILRHDYGIVDDRITWDVIKSHFQP